MRASPPLGFHQLLGAWLRRSLGTCKGSLSPLQFFSSFQFQFQDSGAVETFDPEVLFGEFCPKSESRFNKKPSRKNDSRITLGGKEILRGQRVSKETRKLDTFKAENIRNCPPNLFWGYSRQKKVLKRKQNWKVECFGPVNHWSPHEKTRFGLRFLKPLAIIYCLVAGQHLFPGNALDLAVFGFAEGPTSPASCVALSRHHRHHLGRSAWSHVNSWGMRPIPINICKYCNIYIYACIYICVCIYNLYIYIWYVNIH